MLKQTGDVKMVILAKNTIERLMKHFGADRIGDSAKEEMINVLESIAKDITEKAIEYAKHAKRKTIKKEDVTLASRDILKKD